MAIWVSSLASAPRLARTLSPERIVSLLSPYDDFPEFDGVSPARHLKIAIHDINEDTGDWRAPATNDVERILDFVSDWDRSAPLLVHCFAGISRSTATAFIAACLHAPDASEQAIAQEIRRASPTAKPNARLVALADEKLGRQGRMIEAVAAIGPGDFSVQAEPFQAAASFLRIRPDATR